MSHQTADEIRTDYVKLMGQPLGRDFHELMQDAARLHLKWNEFLPLYAGPKSRIEALNKAAPGFFWLAQNAWWNDILMHIFRMTDGNRHVLSIPRLDVPKAIDAAFKAKLATLKNATLFAHKLRHEYIGHRNREVALQVRPIPPSSVAQVNEAIAAIDDSLHFVESHFRKRAPIMYEHLDVLGGSKMILWFVQRGLKARDEDRAAHKLLRFED